MEYVHSIGEYSILILISFLSCQQIRQDEKDDSNNERINCKLLSKWGSGTSQGQLKCDEVRYLKEAAFFWQPCLSLSFVVGQRHANGGIPE